MTDPATLRHDLEGAQGQINALKVLNNQQDQEIAALRRKTETQAEEIMSLAKRLGDLEKFSREQSKNVITLGEQVLKLAQHYAAGFSISG